MQGITRGVTFGEKHSYDTWGLYLKSYPLIEPPIVQSNTISVPGRDGLLNLTKALDGTVHYESRVITLEFTCIKPREEWPEIYSSLQDYLHGQELKIILDDDPSYYYFGQLEVAAPTYNNAYFTITVNGTVDPYKMETTSSLEDWLWDPFDFESGTIREYKDMTVEGTLDVTVIGSRKPVRPEFIVSSTDGAGMTLTYNGTIYTLPEGRSVVPTICLKDGEYLFIFTGHGTVSVDYRGGRL